jgi:hypothetical protein
VRITDADGNALSAVYLALTDDEARELASDLETLQSAEKGWHAHVSDADFQRELTLYRADDETAIF